jgi:glucose-6-phosphate 1-dehydrogenase
MAITLRDTPAVLASPALPVADPCVLVIFGATGDLAKRKLLPALYNLSGEGCLLDRFLVLGTGRSQLDDEAFRAAMRAGVAQSRDTRHFTDERWQHLAPRLSYLAGDPTDPATHRAIGARLEQLHAAGTPANRLFYLSTPPSLAPRIVTEMGAQHHAAEDQGWSRLIVEKPFGTDLASAQQLNAMVLRVFDERQVYRIDHYLGKDTVQNIVVFRFGNTLFEPVWNRNYIDYVEITAAEALGADARAGFYEETGALRDMVANHLLQLLTLTAMEPPVAFDADAVREAKVQVLRAMHPMTPAQVARYTVRGQYGAGVVAGESVPGYRAATGVAPDSVTETFAAVEFHIDNWRWAEVPFYVRTGKRLARQVTEIAVHFKRTPQALFARTLQHHIDPNVIVLRLQPNEGITISFGAKRPGVEMHTDTVHLDFGYEAGFGLRSPTAYETLLLDAMRGDATLFTRRDEIEAQWRLITPILAAWSQHRPGPFPNYAAGSNGPAEADALLRRAGHRWRPLTDAR